MTQMVETVGTGKEQLASASCWMGAVQNAGERLGIVAGKTRAFATRLLDRADEAKHNNPIQFLAILAGIAIVAGFSIRLWRSNA
jgi:hypothetical protein